MIPLLSLLPIKSIGKSESSEMANLSPPMVYDTELHDSPGLEITGKVMVGVMVILFFTVVLFLFLHLYIKTCFPHRHDQQEAILRRRRRRVHFATTDNCHGLDKSVLNSIPVVIFSAKDKEMECTVCLSDALEGEKVRILPKCNHGFHVDCIDMWFASNSTCPICRNLVSVEDKSDTKAGDLAVFPTNVLVWGNQGEVTSLSSNSEEPSSSSSSTNVRPNEMVVIDIPRQIVNDEEIKSPIMRQLKSFKRLLSMGTARASPSSSTEAGKTGPEQC